MHTYVCVRACKYVCMCVSIYLHNSCSECSVLQQVKDPAVSGLYEAIVVHADHSAVAFFKKYGFTDDLILNSKWA